MMIFQGLTGVEYMLGILLPSNSTPKNTFKRCPRGDLDKNVHVSF